MANAAESLPYTQYIIWVQVLPQYFNQPYARSFGYQILIALSTNFIGYGLAGLTRSFLVYPSFCLWPGTFTTIAMNDALHNETNDAVVGPFKKVFTISRLRFFLWTFAAMFVYFWFPNYLFEAMSYFSWMTWIAPNHKTLNAVTGMRQGLGVRYIDSHERYFTLIDDSCSILSRRSTGTFSRILLNLWYVLIPYSHSG